MTPLELAVLLSFLLPCALHDLWTETIPPRLLAPLGIGLLILLWGTPLRWYPFSALIGFTAFWLAGLPWGDRFGLLLAGGCLPPEWAAQATLLAVSAAGVMIFGVGRYVSVIGVPFFPVVTASIVMVVCAHYWI